MSGDVLHWAVEEVCPTNSGILAHALDKIAPLYTVVLNPDRSPKDASPSIDSGCPSVFSGLTSCRRGVSYQLRNLSSRAGQDRSSLHHSKRCLVLVTRGDLDRGSYHGCYPWTRPIPRQSLGIVEVFGKIVMLVISQSKCSFSILIRLNLHLNLNSYLKTYRGNPTPRKKMKGPESSFGAETPRELSPGPGARWQISLDPSASRRRVVVEPS